MEDIEKQRRKTMSHEENGNMIATRLDLERVVLLTTPRYLHFVTHNNSFTILHCYSWSYCCLKHNVAIAAKSKNIVTLLSKPQFHPWSFQISEGNDEHVS